jgi:hypothetical protein
MDIGTLIGLVITLLSLAFSLVITVVVGLVSVLLPLAIVGIVTFVVVKQLQAGQSGLALGGPVMALQLAQPASRPAGANRLKHIVCRTCGGSKVVPPKTAFVYCDYCGTLCDWDFQIACRGRVLPGPAYEALAQMEAPRQAAAKGAGDREAYAACTRRLFDAHFKACPQSWSPRLGDADYRSALLEHTVMQYTAAAFDPECVALEEAMNAAVKKLQWTPAFPQPRVERASFERLLDAVLAHNHRFTALAEPLLSTHPDEPTIELQRRVARSAFAQGWMPYLDKSGQDAMIAKLDLGGDYIDVPTVDTTERHCGGCARTLRVVAGARKVVCEDCGHTNDVERPEIRCSGCAGPVSVMWSKRSFKCPSCSMELRVD